MVDQPVIEGNRFLATLGSRDFQLLSPHLVAGDYERGHVLYEAGEDVDTVYFPDGAVVSVVTHMKNGQMVESCAIGQESAYGLVNAIGDKHACHRVVVQIGGRMLQMPAVRLREAAAESASLSAWTILHVQAMFIQTEQSVACNAVHQVEARLCRWLLMCQDRAGERALPLTQESLSYMLGVQRTTVTVAASALQSAGLIRYSRGMIEILDRERLERDACECYTAVKRKIQSVLRVRG